MPKNVKKGKNSSTTLEQETIDIEYGQQYARVIRGDGDGRFIVITNDGQNVSALVCGRMWKRVWINKDDIVVISLREGMDQANNKTYGEMMKGDIVSKISPTVYGKLKRLEGFVLLNAGALKEDSGKVTLNVIENAETTTEVNTTAAFEWEYAGDEEDDGNESDSSAASHDSKKKEKRKKAGQAKKELTNADIDRI